MTTLHSSVNSRMRLALKQMLGEFQASHFLTLAFHDEHINMVRATKKVAKWHHHVMHRLFGRRCFQLPVEQTIEFLLLPEAGNANLQFHGLIRVPPNHVARFESYALPHWRRIAQIGTVDLQILLSEKREKLQGYITKGFLASEVLHSSMLCDTPVFSKSELPLPNKFLMGINPVTTEVPEGPVVTSTPKGNGIHLTRSAVTPLTHADSHKPTTDEEPSCSQ